MINYKDLNYITKTFLHEIKETSGDNIIILESSGELLKQIRQENINRETYLSNLANIEKGMKKKYTRILGKGQRPFIWKRFKQLQSFNRLYVFKHRNMATFTNRG